LAILDSRGNRLFGLDIVRKSGEILAGGEEIADSRAIACFLDNIFLFGKKGIFAFNLKDKKVRGVLPPEEGFAEVKLFSAFSGNLYLADKTNLWRYQGGEKGFSEKQGWFVKGREIDLSSMVSMAIDGAVWFLREDGKIFKFSQGLPVNFEIKGLDRPFLGARVLYTSGEEKNLYVLDQEGKRLVVLDKQGESKSQYLWSGMADVSDMVVSEREKKIFLLAGEKIYALDLRD